MHYWNVWSNKNGNIDSQHYETKYFTALVLAANSKEKWSVEVYEEIVEVSDRADYGNLNIITSYKQQLNSLYSVAVFIPLLKCEVIPWDGIRVDSNCNSGWRNLRQISSIGCGCNFLRLGLFWDCCLFVIQLHVWVLQCAFALLYYCNLVRFDNLLWRLFFLCIHSWRLRTNHENIIYILDTKNIW